MAKGAPAFLSSGTGTPHIVERWGHIVKQQQGIKGDGQTIPASNGQFAPTEGGQFVRFFHV